MDISVRDGSLYEFGPFLLDPTRRVLTHDGEPVTLSPTLFDTLLYFVEHPARVVTKDELLDAIWPRKVVDDSNVTQTIFTLRRALAAAGASDPYIVTQPGQGYRFAQPVATRGRRLDGSAGSGAAPSTTDSPAKVSAPRKAWTRSVRLGAVVAGLLVIIGVAAGAWFWGRQGAPSRRVLVMSAFENRTDDPAFGRIFAEAARIDLQQSPYLSVLPEQRVQDTLVLMTRSKDEPLTPAVSQEVCARNNGSATVRGGVAQVGAIYLLTLTAEDCANGDTLAAEKAEVKSRDGLLEALDGLAARLRRRLGESAGSVGAFSVPLPRARTGSLEALRAYAEGRYDFEHGKRADAIPLFQQAIALDPDFAAAHADLAITYLNLKSTDQAVAEITQARRTMDRVDPRERLFIRFQFSSIVTRDIDEGIRVLRSWTEIYPNDASAWANLANAETWRGRPLDAIEPARKALELEPQVESAYVVLARAYLHAGRLKDARAICDAGVAHKVDGDDLHGVAYETAIAQDDVDGAAREVRWARGKSGERTMLLKAAQAAFGRGQVRQGQALFAAAVARGASVGLPNMTAAPNARLLWDMGLPDLARASLSEAPAGFDSADYRYDLAEFGDAARARALLNADLAKSPADTLLNRVSASEVRAALDLRQGRPGEAIADLRPAAPYETRTLDIPYLAGVAYLAARDGDHAAQAFREILDNRGVEAVSVHYALAHLGLARADVLRRDPAAARRDYQAFFDDWKDADPGLPLMRQARAEFAGL